MRRTQALILWTVAVYQMVTLSIAAGCSTKADVTFVLDSSESVGQTNFVKQLEFTKNVVSNLDVGPDRVKVSAVTFSSGVHNQFFLDKYASQAEVMTAIQGIKYLPGLADTGDAITYVTQTSFSPGHGARSYIPHVMVLVTDGPSTTREITKIKAQTAKDNNVVIYTVGVGSGIDTDELKSVSSNPDSKYFLSAENFNSLGSLSSLLSTKICNEVPNRNHLPAPTGCLQKADLVFMVDSSSTVGSVNFEKTTNFIKNFVTKLNVSQDGVHVGIEQFSDFPTIEFPLGHYYNRHDILRAIHSIQLQGGGSNTGDAIKFAWTNMFSPQYGARSNVSRIAIMITDGGTSEVSTAISQANQARQQHVGILGVGIGPAINIPELNLIVDQPTASHVINVNSYDQLESVSNQLMSMACGVQESIDFGKGINLNCSDKINNCHEYSSRVCTDYRSWAVEKCKDFCGLCPFVYPELKQTCFDNLSNCASYGSNACTQYPKWAADNCKMSCGLCNASDITGGFYNKCSYKGNVYSTGQKWYDGCNYECVCQDGSRGKYQCYNRCPVYYNLPSMCTLIKKQDECCKEPVCNFNPTVQKFESSGRGQNSLGIAVCVYQGKQYYQYQSWTDGCDYQCTCTNASTGAYVCRQLCPSYTVLSKGCYLEQTPGQCCKQPVCEFTRMSGTFGGNGMISGNGTSMQAPVSGQCLDLVTCANYGSDVCSTYKDWAMKNCRNTCNFCQSVQQPGPNDHCVFDGKYYKQGAVWAPSCNKRCHCENARYGYYRCVNTCPNYTNLLSGCKMVQRNGECCERAECSEGRFQASAVSSYSLGSGTNIYTKNINSLFGQYTLSWYNQSQDIDGCLYKGKVYTQDQSWIDGCSKYCICVDAKKGQMSCKARCPTFSGMTKTCVLRTDSNDPCCQTPVCTYDATIGKVPQPIPTFGQGHITNSVVSPQTGPEHHNKTYVDLVVANKVTPNPPTVDPVKISKGGFCLYNGKQYSVGEKWEVGCQYNCICDDGQQGHYTCVEKCVHYQLPPGCFLVQDPLNPCCKIPRCTAPPTYISITGIRTTPQTKTGMCNYNGEFYQKGQTWYDGCSYRCTCEEGGIYRCMSRCPEYPQSTGADCKLVRDPRDPSCCEMRVCGTSGSIAIPPAKYTGVEHTFQGHSDVCIYKGQAYKEGDIWEDGCDFICQCDDQVKGIYSCTDKCPVYMNLEPGCTMEKDFTNPCCEKPHCSVTGPPPPTRVYSQGQNVPPLLSPTKQYCVYKDVSYLQGQTWEDGCSYRCRCDDASRGIYTCDQRCSPLDPNIPDNCNVKIDPRDSCCLAQFCSGTTVSPNSQIIVPVMKPKNITGHVLYPKPIPGGTTLPVQLGTCLYKGKEYSQGQTFEDGCDFNCECFNATEGRYRCSPMCPVYDVLPSNCRLVKNPKQPCCKIPECYPVILQTTVQPPYQVTATPITPTPTFNVCMYKGVGYSQGQRWFDGCDFTCVCEDAVSGVYRCNNRCPQLTTTGSNCTEQADPRDPLCCKISVCSPMLQYVKVPPRVLTGGGVTPTMYPQTTSVTPKMYPQSTSVTPTMYPHPTSPTIAVMTPMTTTTLTPVYKQNYCLYKGKTYSPGQRWQDGCQYDCECLDNHGNYRCLEKCAEYTDLKPGCSLVVDYNNPCCKKPYCVPTMSPPPSVGTQTPNAFCMYSGVAFKQSETWNDGCDLTCTCENATTGFYRCNDRCPQWPKLPSGCRLVTDPNQDCCKKPYCEPTALFPPIPTPGQVSSGTTPTTPSIITLPTPIKIGYSDHCQYKGVRYNRGDKWDDGCSLECECLDDQTGKYQCLEKCQDYSNIPMPSYCKLILDPRNPCCKVIQCSPTPEPVTTTPLYPVPVTSPRNPRPEVCIYKGNPYTEGQQWNDGCHKTCICESGKSNYVRCSERCSSYPQNTGCTMVPDKRDPLCCQIPSCIPPEPSGKIPGQLGTKNGTGVFSPLPSTNTNYCVYKNQQYSIGQKWQDGCNYNCVCVDGNTGKYTCKERCPSWPSNIPAGCSFVQDQDDICCKSVFCDPHKTTVSVPGMVPTTPPTYNPQAPTTTPGQYITHSRPQAYCLYYGVLYQQGQTWDQGCQKKCRCDDASNNYYTCFDRCPTFTDLPVGCVYRTDPQDPCCQIPICPPPTTTTMQPFPYTGSSSSPTPPTITKYPIPPLHVKPEIIGGPGHVQSSKYCEYKGLRYSTGQQWRDGCGYDCICIDGVSGVYKCSERCPRFPELPAGCEMVSDVNDLCCRVPRCSPTLKPTPTPSPQSIPPTNSPSSVVLLPPPSEVCSYKGKVYTQGQSWYDGCDKRCVCTTAKTGVYQCSSRCPQYDNKDNCLLVPDSSDPECCMKPQCPSPQLNIITGNKTQTTHPDVCVYNGNFYQQGQRWQDGCKYTCQCVNASTGVYKCLERCIDVSSIPPSCNLKYNPQDPCCPLPDCLVPPLNTTIIPTTYNPLQPHLKYCIYKGIPYRQGQTFNIGCQQTCKCTDAIKGIVSCVDRCPSYPPLKPGCQLVTDPNDNCCQAPICIDPNPHTPYTVMSGPKGVFTGGQPPQVPGGQNIPQLSSGNVCIYNEKVYRQGQKWRDGCRLECECFDEQTGRYRCTELCTRYPQIPPFCMLVQDPNNTCCQTVYCPTNKNTTDSTKPVINILPSEGCIYNGVLYSQNQQWYDGCDKVCRCEDAMSGAYGCQQRCSSFDKLQSGCTLVVDPGDSECCKMPNCPPVIPNNTSGIVVTPEPVKGVITGIGRVPTNSEHPTPTPGCLYMGKMYHQGQSWDDGCKYRCQCVNETSGQYTCTDRCQNYPIFPPYCTLVQNPVDTCCPELYCDKEHAVPVLPPMYIPVKPSYTNSTPSVFGTAGYCVYNGAYYRQGQTWTDGCSKTCRCDDVTSGLYSCTKRCPTFSNIPDSCSFETDMNDPCCMVPQCTQFPVTNGNTSTGLITPRPGIIIPVPVLTEITGQGTLNPIYNQTNGFSDGVCVYKGKPYPEGQKWDDGCDFRCECMDGSTGQYRCNYRCPQYYNMPDYCVYKQDPNDSCCRRPTCDPNKPTTTLTATVTTTVHRQTITTTSSSTEMCVYQGKTFRQGSKWEDGCDLRCSCVNATMNVYQCKARCPRFQSLPSQCTLVNDPSDSCCKIPSCTPSTGSKIQITPIYGTSGVATNNSLGTLPIAVYNVLTGNYGNTTGGMNGGCVYKGKLYQEGQSWNDGCLYVCTCKHAGQYECVSRCPVLPPSLPSYCQKVMIPGQCCAKYHCDIPGVSYKPPGEIPVTTAPTFTAVPQNPWIIEGQITTTQSPLLPGGGYPILLQQFSGVRSQCIFHKRATATSAEKYLLYNEGETWRDGCEYNCKCVDGKTGYYYCNPLCPVYNNLPSNKCYLLRVDGECCNQPRCALETGEVVNPLTTQTQYTIIGSLTTGYTGFRQGLYQTNVTTGCTYKGRTYQQGQSWTDGCDFDCRCDDAGQGAYSCTPRCPTYTSIPSFCTMVKGVESCCATPVCSQSPQSVTTNITTTPPRHTCPYCADKLDNCEAYGQDACQGVYVPWAKRNCACYCGFCDHPTVTTVKPTKPPCPNTLDNCEEFGKDACVGIFQSWAMENCAGFCNLCPTVPTQGSCHDKQPVICKSQKDIICSNGAYQDWVKENCQQTCYNCQDNTAKQCTYKGSQYIDGQSWKDGCSVNCTCRDGIPACTNRCPTYDHLPPNCALLPDSENCCMVPVCNHSVGCHYKGKTYHQDDTWSDGCSYDCVCNDASNGQYQCKEKCPLWDLPPVCTWEDPQPGKCCKQPSCPPPYVISGYPDQ